MTAPPARATRLHAAFSVYSLVSSCSSSSLHLQNKRFGILNEGISKKANKTELWELILFLFFNISQQKVLEKFLICTRFFVKAFPHCRT